MKFEIVVKERNNRESQSPTDKNDHQRSAVNWVKNVTNTIFYERIKKKIERQPSYRIIEDSIIKFSMLAARENETLNTAL